MKKMKMLLITEIVTTAMLFGSCSSEDSTLNVGYDTLKSINITIEDVDLSSLTDDSNVDASLFGLKSSWTIGDMIGIRPLNGDAFALSVSEDVEGSTAHIDCSSLALSKNTEYYAFYPLDEQDGGFHVNYTGQVQNGNNSTTGIATFDYLAAIPTQPNDEGEVNLTMKHLGAFVRMQLTMPEEATIISANMASDGTEFVTDGVIIFSSSHPSIASMATAADFSISLTDVTCNKDDVVTLFAMIAPVDLSDSNITITLTDDNGKTYIYKCGGFDFRASNSYNIAITEACGGTGVTIPDEEHECVDLGLSVKWATCNIGANVSEEFGDYFAWGEITGYNDGKKSFNWHTYKWSSDASWTGLTKYTCLDGQTVGLWYDNGSFIGDNIAILEMDDDVAHAKWGGTWRLPTKTEFEELCNNCIWEWTTLNGVKGYSVTSQVNNESVFFPASGSRFNDKVEGLGMSDNARCWGSYWASSLQTNYSYSAFGLHFGQNEINCDYRSRFYGFSVRAVCQ